MKSVHNRRQSADIRRSHSQPDWRGRNAFDSSEQNEQNSILVHDRASSDEYFYTQYIAYDTCRVLCLFRKLKTYENVLVSIFTNTIIYLCMIFCIFKTIYKYSTPGFNYECIFPYISLTAETTQKVIFILCTTQNKFLSKFTSLTTNVYFCIYLIGL